MTRRLAAVCASHPWRTVAAWVGATALAVVLVGALLGDRLTSDRSVTNDPESLRANDLLSERFPQALGFDEFVVIRSDSTTVDGAPFRGTFGRLVAALRAAEGVEGVVSHADGDPALVSTDRRAALVAVMVAGEGAEHVQGLIDVVERFDRTDGFSVAVTGTATLHRDFQRASESDLRNGELRYGLPAALVVLAITFGAVVAAMVPLLLAVVSITVALGLTALVAIQWELSVFVTNMLVGMGFALGIDYALFVVSRYREERANGRAERDAIVAAGATASRAVLFSGSAVVLAMSGLLLVQSTIMRSLALGGILVGIVSVAAALTLLPALLRLLGDRIDRMPIPLVGRRARGAPGGSKFWGAVVDRVVRRPALSLALGVLLLLAAAAPVAGLEIGAAGITTLPDDFASKRGHLELRRSFPAASASPALIVVDGPASSFAVRDAIGALEERLAADARFGPAVVQMSPTGDLALVSASLAGDAVGESAVAAVRDLRAEHVPAAFAGSGAAALVTGATAENIDYFDVMSRWLPIVIAVVLGLSFLLLTIAFRSLVVAATAIVLNLLSVGAAYGLLVLVFREGVGASLLGFQQVDVVEAWVPAFLFAVLFGLSMDYQVFLLSRIRERFVRTGDTSDAISVAIGSTARIITGAALVIVAVFSGFAAGELVMFQQMGFGIAVALLIDATLVRSVLVPAAMQLLGEWNWYLPRWLGWLPRLEVEGHAEESPGAGSSTGP